MDEEYYDFLVNKAVEKGIKDGHFDNLPGKGKPINWEDWDSPYVKQEDRTINLMLKNAGFAPGWVADRRDIVEQIEAARGALSRVWKWVSAHGGTRDALAGQQWSRALESFTRRVNEINQHIRDHNLVLPDSSIALKLLNLEGEISEIQRVQ
jgi:DnaJ homolog subfamily C member 28